MTTVLKSFDKWKEFLGERVDAAENAGMNDETMSKLAVEIGDFLANKIDPENQQERVLKELWDVGNDEERRMMARMMIKWVNRS